MIYIPLIFTYDNIKKKLRAEILVIEISGELTAILIKTQMMKKTRKR